jgi:hypothetical protein
MYKNLSIAVLLVAFGLVAARSTGAPAPTLTSPTIVKKVALTNQTGPIPTTTIFTPGTSGLFRVSVYMTQAVAGNSPDYWTVDLGWSDDAGKEAAATVSSSVGQVPPMAWGFVSGSFQPGSVVTVEGRAGQPLTFDVTDAGGFGNDGSYSLYITVERLI